jgi:hypothetical protein
MAKVEEGLQVVLLDHHFLDCFFAF